MTSNVTLLPCATTSRRRVMDDLIDRTRMAATVDEAADAIEAASR